jgi:hypothetical protein
MSIKSSSYTKQVLIIISDGATNSWCKWVWEKNEAMFVSPCIFGAKEFQRKGLQALAKAVLHMISNESAD